MPRPYIGKREGATCRWRPGLRRRRRGGGGFVKDDRDGNIAEQALELPLVFESVEEGAVFHFFEDFDGDAAGDVNAAKRQNFQSQIPCFGAVDGGPEIQSVRTDAAGLVQTAASDLRSRVGVRIFEGGMYHFRREKLVNGAEAAAGENQFPAYLGIAAAHEPKQFDLLLGVRREIGMAAFGRHDAVAATVPHKKRLAESSTREIGRASCREKRE